MNVTYKSDLFSRVTQVSLNRKRLMTPTYFPAVSSYGIKYQFDTLVRLLITYSYPRLLVSAYDFNILDNEENKKLAREIGDYSNRGCFVFFDSGIYESSWRADDKWTYDRYRNAISQIDFDFYSSFDVLPQAKDPVPEFIERTLENILISRELSDKSGFVPILHGRSPDELVLLLAMLVKEHPHLCDFVAIPERDCGDDIIEKAQTIVKIRKLLDKHNHKRVLHILGCGNPISLILFSYCGANMFDSLDWVKYAIDPTRLIIRDLSHLELTKCQCAICSGMKRPYIEKVLLHNLLFYQNYMLQIQLLIRRNEISAFLAERIGQDIVDKIRDIALKSETS